MSLLTRFRRPKAQERTTAEEPLTDVPAEDPPPGHRTRGRVLTALAGVLVFIALVAPNQIGGLTLGAFLRIPIEALAGVALLLVLPARARGVAAVVGGVVLGLLSIEKLVDMGFFAVLARPFDPVLDWILIDDAVAFLTDAAGRAGAIGASVAVVALIIAVLVLTTLAVRRLTRSVIQHRTIATRAVAALAPVWLICAVLGAQLVPGQPLAAEATAGLVYDRALQIRAGLADEEEFAAQAAIDAFRDTPPEDLLPGLRGKDVAFAFVESYGRVAVEDPEVSPQVTTLLDAGNARLAAAGFASRSAFLTSPTAGSGSGLAHATLFSGLWITNNQRWRTLVSSDRLTLSKAFQRASWRTVGMMPGNTWAWPEGTFYGFDQVYDSRNVGYRGPAFSWATMPDQYALESFERMEHGKPDHPPLMSEIVLVSSHAPWAPTPHMIDWKDIGDGSIFAPMATEGDPPDVVWRDPARVRSEYARSIAYSLDSLISYVETYGDDNLVLVFLGDHQPVPIVAGDGATRDVPITIVARDPKVLDQISGWGWQDGLKPGPQAPVWRMDSFRDKFLTAFGTLPGPAGAASPPGH